MTEYKARITKIHRLSTHDGPGLRTSIFFKGCPLRCVWCHNPETQDYLPEPEWTARKCIHCGECEKACPDGLIKIGENSFNWDRDNCIRCEACTDACPSKALVMLGAKYYSVDEIFNEIMKDSLYYQNSGGGVTFTGGEPLVYPDFIIELAKKCKEAGLNVALDTCGFVSKDKLMAVLPFVDYVFYDLKEFDNDKHVSFTGRKNEKVISNLRAIASGDTDDPGYEIWIRTPLVPGLTATEENVSRTGDFISKLSSKRITRWELLSFNNLCEDKYIKTGKTWELSNVELFGEEEIVNLKNIAAESVIGDIRVSVSGFTAKNTTVS